MKGHRIAFGLLLAGALVFAAGYRDVRGDECSGTGVGSAQCPKDPGAGGVRECYDVGDPDACPTKYKWEKSVGPFICIPPDDPPTPTECGLAGQMTPLGWQPSMRTCALKSRCYWDAGDGDGVCRADYISTEVVPYYYKANICPQIQGQGQ